MARGNGFVGWGLVAVLVVVAGCGGGRDGAAGVTTVAPSTTPPAPPSVTAATTVPMTVPSTVAPTTAARTTLPADEGSPGFVPACVEQEAAGAVDATGPSDPAPLGPLATEPAFVIDLPAFRDLDSPDPGPVVAGVERTSGGLLVRVSQDSYGLSEPAWQLVAFDDDGSLRWRRCGLGYVQGPVSAPADGSGGIAVLWSVDLEAGMTPMAFDLTTGADVALTTSVDIGDRSAVAFLDDVALFSRVDGDRVDLGADRLVLVDLGAGSANELPFPDRASGQEPFRLIWELVDGGGPQPVVVQRDPFGAIVGAYVADAWTTDAAALAAIAGPSVRETGLGGDGETGIEVVDGDGSRRWFVPTDGPLPGEGFHGSVVGDLVLANVCREADTVTGCATGAFVALDLASGEQRWELPGFRPVGILGDRFGIIGDGDVSRMFDLATGEPIPGQEWDVDTFRNECCGDGEYVWVGGEDGWVWAVDHDRISVYNPQR